MSEEMINIIKKIMIIIGIATIIIFIFLKFIEKKYSYYITYYHAENKYEIKITDNYDITVEISVLCKEEKCVGNYNNKISYNVKISKDNVKALINEFNLERGIVYETNEEKVTDFQKELLTEIIR